MPDLKSAAFGPKTPVRVVFALVMREMTTRYGRSAGGYLWAVIEPVGAIALLALVFSAAFRSPPLGTSFALFYATGYLPFMMYADIGQRIGTAIQFSRQLLYYPSVTLMDALIARFFLNLITHLVVVCIVIGAIIVFADIQPILDLASIQLSLALAALLGFGVGAVNCALFSLIPMWQQLWSVLTRPLFVLSGVIFTYESVPQEFRTLIWWNPLIHVIGLMRQGIYPTYEASYAAPVYVLLIALTSSVMGTMLLRRFTNKILEQ